MSNEIVLELKEKDALTNFSNGDYIVRLAEPQKIENGDTISIKNVFLDTISLGSQQVIIEEDIVVKMGIGFYMINKDVSTLGNPKTFTFAGLFNGNNEGLFDGVIKLSENDGDAVGNITTPMNNTYTDQGDTTTSSGVTIPVDYLKYISCFDTTIGTQGGGNLQILDQIIFFREDVDSSKKGFTSFIGKTTVLLRGDYIDPRGEKQFFIINDTISGYETPLKSSNLVFKIVLKTIVFQKDTLTFNKPEFLATSGNPLTADNLKRLENPPGYFFFPQITDFGKILEPRTIFKTINISKGSYTPADFCDIFNRALTEVKDGDVPRNTTTPIPNDSLLRTTAVDGGIFVREDGAFRMDIDSSKTNFYYGTNQFTLNWSDIENVFQFQFLHSPLYNDSGNIINRLARTQGLSDFITYDIPNKVVDSGDVDNNILLRKFGSTGGIYFTEMSCSTVAEDKPFDFWGAKLGFNQINSGRTDDLIVSPQYISKDVSGTTEFVPFWNFIIDGFQTTNARNDIDNLVVKSSKSNEVPPIITNHNLSGAVAIDSLSTDTSVINADTKIFDYADNTGYYLIEIDAGFNNTVIDSVNTKRKIKCIAGKFYSSSSYTSGADGGISYTHSGMPLTLSDFKIRILDSDGTLATSVGDDNTIFLTINKAPPQPILQPKK